MLSVFTVDTCTHTLLKDGFSAGYAKDGLNFPLQEKKMKMMKQSMFVGYAKTDPIIPH